MNCERCFDDVEATERLIAEKGAEVVELLLCSPHSHEERKKLKADGWALEPIEHL